MSWLDYINSQNRKNLTGISSRSSRVRLGAGPSSASWYDPKAHGSTTLVRTAASQQQQQQSAQPSPLERLSVSLPFSSPDIPGQEHKSQYAGSTKGDFLGSVGGATGDIFGTALNPASIVPWFMERIHEITKKYADESEARGGFDPVGASMRVGDAATGAWLGAFHFVADPVGRAMSALPDWNRDESLMSRARLARAIASGSLDVKASEAWDSPVKSAADTLNMAGQLVGGALQGAGATFMPGSPVEDLGDWMSKGMFLGNMIGPSAAEQTAAYKMYGSLIHSTDKSVASNAQKRIEAIWTSIDLADDVKALIRSHPDATDEQIKEWLDEAPSGRQWTYAGGTQSLDNWVSPLVWYGAEMYGANKLMGMMPAPGWATAAGRASGVVNYGKTAVQAMAKWGTRSGLVAAPIMVALDTKARMEGDEAAVKWWQDVSTPGDFASDPEIQLVSGFAIDPLHHAWPLAKKGVLAIGTRAASALDTAIDAAGPAVGAAARRAGVSADRILIGKAAGAKFVKAYDSDSVVYGALARMYRLGSAEEAMAWAPDHGYASRGEVFDEVVGLAADHVLAGLPPQERMRLLAMHGKDPVELTKAVLSGHADEIIDVVLNQPQVLADRWQVRSWNYHDQYGEFNADVMASNAADFRRAKTKFYDLRNAVHGVTGYQEFLAPQGAAIARDFVAQNAVDGKLAAEGLNGFQHLIVKFPSLRKAWQGTVEPGLTEIPVEQVDAVIQKAEIAYAAEMKVNPQRVLTGADPVLRRASATLRHDTARALGTSTDVVDAVASGAPEGEGIVRQFLKDKLDIPDSELAAMAPEEVMGRARTLVEERTAPWLEAGDRVVEAEKSIQTASKRLAELFATPERARDAGHADRVAALELEIAQLRRIVSDAGDPLVTMGDRVTTAGMNSRAAERVRTMDPKRVTPSQRAFLERYVSGDIGGAFYGQTSFAGVSDLDLWEAAYESAKDAAVLGTRESSLVERALKKIRAREALDRIAAIDSQIGIMHETGADVTRLLRRVQGQLRWKGGGPACPDGIRKSAATWFFNHGMGATAHDIMVVGDSEAWATILRNPRFNQASAGYRGLGIWNEAFSRSQKSLVERLARESGMAVDDLGRDSLDTAAESMPGMTEKFGGDSQAWLEELVRLTEEREQILKDYGYDTDRGGMRFAESNAVRHASMSVPKHIVAQARALSEGGELVADPMATVEMEDSILPRLVAALDSEGGAALPAVKEIALEDAVLYSRLHNAVEDINRSRYIQGGGLMSEIDGSYDLARQPTSLTVDQVLADPSYAPRLRDALVPEGWTPKDPVEAAAPETELDALIRDGDSEAVAQRSQDFLAAQDAGHEPVKTTVSVAKLVKIKRRSTEWVRRINEYGVHRRESPDLAIMSAPGNRDGMEAISLLNHGVLGTRPATIDGVVRVLRNIEDGSATRMGMGVRLQAEAQRVASELLDQAVKDAKRSPFAPGEFGPGVDPASFAMDEWVLARDLKVKELKRTGVAMPFDSAQRAIDRAAEAADGSTALSRTVKVTYDADDPLGTLQYAIKAKKKDTVVLELQKVPGLTEELMDGRYKTFEQRAARTRLGEAANWVFGGRSNAEIAAATERRFAERLAKLGIDGSTAKAIWEEWKDQAVSSRSRKKVSLPDTMESYTAPDGTTMWRRSGPGVRTTVPGDNARWASSGNIPGGDLQHIANEAVERHLSLLDEKGMLDQRYARLARSVQYDDVFREANSLVRRTLKDRVPLGDALASAYGMVAHNSVATTAYYQFRFQMDMRYHAMNFFESQILHLGRAGLRQGELDDGMLGYTRDHLASMADDSIGNTGYAVGRTRLGMAIKTFMREQAPALEGELQVIKNEEGGDQLMERALLEMADREPDLAQMIRDNGGTPEAWLKALNEDHARILRHAEQNAIDGEIDAAFQGAMEADPALSEVYSRLAQVNKEHWANVRETFYGNPNRSRFERVMNSYLLYWPISYQIKSAKWLAGILFDRAGGLKTNMGGYILLDRMAQSHAQLLSTDPQYRDWFEKHRTLVYAAQMFMPISPESMGVSLNPLMRDLFFGRQRSVLDIGPVYTVGHVIVPGSRELITDLYPTLKDVPVIGDVTGSAYGALTGRSIPKSVTGD